MSKRKLNKQQRNRIASNQAAVTEEADTGDLLHGLVISHFGKEVEVLPLNADKSIAEQSTHRCHFRAKLPTIVCGDYVLWSLPPAHSTTGVIEALLDRRSLLQRPRPYQDPKPVAANIDAIFITLAPRPEPITSLIDRFLIAAENADIEACLLLNKQDLAPAGSEDAKMIDDILAVYTDLGYRVYRHSSLNHTSGRSSSAANIDAANTGTEAFIDALQGKSSILVGQSGVGKSSIINSLSGEPSAKIGDISSSNDKGRHTTTTSQLYQLLGDDPSIASSIIDSPGIREFGLWHLSPDAILSGLPEFERYAMQCKFRDCHHGQSKGCELQAAIDRGDIHPSRISSYYHILDTLDK